MTIAADRSWPIHDVSEHVQVRVMRPMPALDVATEAAVAGHWARALQTRKLFNGRVFSADRISPTLIEGHWTEYRRVLAGLHDPPLQRKLGVRNLAVCGVLHGPDGVVVAQRDPNAVYQPGQWQLPPAGSVDDSSARGDYADLRHAILAELMEELGLAGDSIERFRPLCLVEHPLSGVLDLGIELATLLDGGAIAAAHAKGGNQEYANLMIVPAHEVDRAVAARGGVLVGSARPFLDRLPLPGY